MTDKEKEYLLDWIYKEWDRAEYEFIEKLLFLRKHHNNDIYMDNLIHAFYRYRFYITFLKDLLEVLSFELFDDTTKYKNRSAKFLNSITLSEKEDDLIYSFVLGIIHNNKFSNFDDDK